MYESINVSLPDTHFWGFYLICWKQNYPKNNIILYSIECKEKAKGHCVMNNGSVFSSLPRSTYALYWTHCKNRDVYIVGDSRLTFYQKENTTWTGLRKYKMDNSKFDNYSCYIIETNQNTVNYKKSNCTQKLFFFFVKKTSDRRTFLVQNISEVHKLQHHRSLLVIHHEQHINLYPKDLFLFLQHQNLMIQVLLLQLLYHRLRHAYSNQNKIRGQQSVLVL